MRCPFCQSDDTKVLDTRLLDDGSQVRRRRECIACGERHSTRETVDLNLPRLIKSDESRQTFSEDKLRSGLLKAFEKRPVSISEIETAIQKIQRKLMAQNEREVASSVLGEWVMKSCVLWMKLPIFDLPPFTDNFKTLRRLKVKLIN